MYKISKDFNLCYGHRVFTQSLNVDFCSKTDTKQKCRHLHGHEGKVTVHLEAEDVDTRGMLVDFKELGWLKDFIDNTLDHKFIIAAHDPMFDQLVTSIYDSASSQEPSYLIVHVPGVIGKPVGEVVDLAGIDSSTSNYETLEGYFIVDFVPTSENLAKWMYDIVAAKMEAFSNVKVSCVEWAETPKSVARFFG